MRSTRRRSRNWKPCDGRPSILRRAAASSPRSTAVPCDMAVVLKQLALAGCIAYSISGSIWAADGALLAVRDVGFSDPVAAHADARHDRYLVTNMNGGFSSKDNNGFIS